MARIIAAPSAPPRHLARPETQPRAQLLSTEHAVCPHQNTRHRRIDAQQLEARSSSATFGRAAFDAALCLSVASHERRRSWISAAFGKGRIGVEAALQIVRIATRSTDAAWALHAQRRTIKKPERRGRGRPRCGAYLGPSGLPAPGRRRDRGVQRARARGVERANLGAVARCLGSHERCRGAGQPPCGDGASRVRRSALAVPRRLARDAGEPVRMAAGRRPDVCSEH